MIELTFLYTVVFQHKPEEFEDAMKVELYLPFVSVARG